MTIQEARQKGESLAGQRLDEQTFQEVLAYTVRKSRMTGHDDDYIPLLLVDEIKDHISRERINQYNRQLIQLRKEVSKQCATSACTRLACMDALMKKFPFMGYADVAETVSRLAADISISEENAYARIAQAI